MTITPASLRSDLSGLADAGAKTDACAKRIHEVAQDRRAVVNTRLDALRQRARSLDDEDAGREYEALILERGQLDITLGL